MAPTLKDIAKLAKTSEATVSLVINGRQFHRVSPGLREQIEQIARDVGYKPNRQAQLLARGKSMSIGVLVNSLTNAFFSSSISLLETRLSAAGYHVAPSETRSDLDRERRLFEMSSRRVCDAIVSLCQAFDASEPPPFELSQPVVLRTERFGEASLWPDALARVELDYAPAVDAMFAEFERQGATRIGLLMSRQHDPAQDKPSPRAQHFMTRAQASSRMDAEPVIATVDESAPFSAWNEAARRLLESEPRVDALFVHNAHVAPPVLRAAEDAGRCVGGDLAVATFDDPDFAAWLGPGLTVVREDAETVADALAGIVLAVLDEHGQRARVRQLKAEFEIRGSSSLR